MGFTTNHRCSNAHSCRFYRAGGHRDRKAFTAEPVGMCSVRCTCGCSCWAWLPNLPIKRERIVMNRRTRLLLGLFLVASFSIPASGTMSMPQAKPDTAATASSMVETVAWKRVCKHRKCHRVWIGPRRHWRKPSVVVKPRIVIRPGHRVVRGTRHVRWCENRYRSYNPATDQFLGYDGHYHYCNSPYR